MIPSLSRLSPLSVLALAASSLPLSAAAQVASESAALTRIRSRAPGGTVAWLESSAFEPILAQGLAHPLIARVLEVPIIAADLKRKGVDPETGLAAAKALLGQNPFELAHALASGGVALGFLDVTPGKEAPFVMLRGRDGDEMETAVEDLASVLSGLGVLIETRTADARELDPSVRKAWTFRGSDAVAAFTREGTLILTKSWEDAVLCCAVTRRSEAVPAARRELGSTSNAETFAWFDLDAMEGQVGLKDLRAMASEPGVHFLLGPALAYLGQGSSLAMDLDVSSEALELRMFGEGIEAGAGSGSFPPSASTAAGDRTPAQAIAVATLYRDIHFLLDHRTELFPPRTQPGIAEGLGNLALLVGGPDALDELLASLRPTLRLQSESIDFAENAEPDVPLPSLSLEVDVDNPEVNGSRLTSAFQTAVTLTNVERAMKGEDGLRLGLESVEGVTLTRAKLQPPPAGASVDLAYNLEPACALVGGTFLVGTHAGPIARTIRRTSSETGATRAKKDVPDAWIQVDRIRVQGPPLQAILNQQRDLIVMNAVLEDGKTQSRAEAEADILLELVGHVESADFRSAWRADASSEAGSSTRTIRAGLTLHLLP